MKTINFAVSALTFIFGLVLLFYLYQIDYFRFIGSDTALKGTYGLLMVVSALIAGTIGIVNRRFEGKKGTALYCISLIFFFGTMFFGAMETNWGNVDLFYWFILAGVLDSIYFWTGSKLIYHPSQNDTQSQAEDD